MPDGAFALDKLGNVGGRRIGSPGKRWQVHGSAGLEVGAGVPGAGEVPSGAVGGVADLFEDPGAPLCRWLSLISFMYVDAPAECEAARGCRQGGDRAASEQGLDTLMQSDLAHVMGFWQEDLGIVQQPVDQDAIAKIMAEVGDWGIDPE